MNKGDLVEKIAKEVGLSKKDADAALVSFLSGVMKGVKKEPVQLVGFGTFKNVKRKARTGVNPRTGEKIKIAARTVTTFKASKNCKY